MKQNPHSSNCECSQIVVMLRLESRRWLEGERFACRALAAQLKAPHLLPHTRKMFLCAPGIMKTTDASSMIPANGSFRADKQMLLRSLYHEGQEIYHSFPSCQHGSAVADSHLHNSSSKLFFWSPFVTKTTLSSVLDNTVSNNVLWKSRRNRRRIKMIEK